MYKRVNKTCEYCQNTYSGIKNSKYCGYSCAKMARKRRVILNCQYCSKEFEVQEWNKDAKFCSFACKSKSQESDILEISCDNCKKIFKRKKHLVGKGKHSFCSKKCSDKFNNGSNHYEWKEHLHDKNTKLALKQWALKIKERDGYICQLCGETDRTLLEAHHMKHRSKFPEFQFDFNNGITLCLKCHALQHIDDPKSLRLINYKMTNIKKAGPWNPQKATAYVGKKVLKNGDTIPAIKGAITPVPNGPLIKKNGSSLKNGGKLLKSKKKK